MTVEEALTWLNDNDPPEPYDDVCDAIAAEVRRLRRNEEADDSYQDALITQIEGLRADLAAARADAEKYKALATEQGCYAAWDEATEDAKVFAAERDAARMALAHQLERHAEAVEAAYREGYDRDLYPIELAWRESEAKARLT